MSQFSATTSLAGRRNAMMIVKLPTGSTSTQRFPLLSPSLSLCLLLFYLFRSAQNVGPPLRKTVGVITWCVQHADVSIAGYAWDHGLLTVLAGESPSPSINVTAY